MSIWPATPLRNTAGSSSLGCKSACSVPLVTSNGTLGTLEIARTTSDVWTDEDVDFLVQVARQIAIAVENALSYRQLKEMKERLATEKLYLEDEIRLDHNNGNMVGEGAAFQSVLKGVQIVAPTDATVLILGETGTGKELVARAIHELSSRSKGSFVKVNCAAIPASLLESELFGHEKGSFTGAVAQKIGRFELAHQGTLFLDEIGEMPLELQPKLLRAIQDQEFERVGGNRTIRTDVRFVAATNRDLKAMVDENRFRADLYYRLHVFPLNVPPLRERREDIPLLTRYFVQKHAQRMGRKIERIPTQALEALTNYDWPGNIRELQNVIERSVILSNGPELRVAMPEFNGEIRPGAAARPGFEHFRSRRAGTNPAGVEGSQRAGRRTERRSRPARPEADDLAIPHAEIQYRPPISVSDGRRPEAGSSGKGRFPAHSHIDRCGICRDVELRRADSMDAPFESIFPLLYYLQGRHIWRVGGCWGKALRCPGFRRLRKIFRVCDRPRQTRRPDDVACRGQVPKWAPETADKQAKMGRFSGCRRATRYFRLPVNNQLACLPAAVDIADEPTTGKMNAILDSKHGSRARQ